jgi:hypothetical protein
VRAQNDFARESFERFNELNRRYLEIVQTMMKATASTAEEARGSGARQAG